jgi:hypothetical protein
MRRPRERGRRMIRIRYFGCVKSYQARPGVKDGGSLAGKD